MRDTRNTWGARFNRAVLRLSTRRARAVEMGATPAFVLVSQRLNAAVRKRYPFDRTQPEIRLCLPLPGGTKPRRLVCRFKNADARRPAIYSLWRAGISNED